VDHREHCDALAEQVAAITDLVDAASPDAPVPTCPGWTATDLAEHLGVIHRWAEHLVRVLAPQRIASDEMDFERGPVGAAWIRDGGARLVATLRSSDPTAPMWAWGADQHVRFWSRRQLHETMVHRMDLEIALGRSPHADVSVAADGIDEFLVNLAAAERFSPGVAQLRGRGERIAFLATDADRRWTVRLDPAGFTLTDAEDADVDLAGRAEDLLLVLYRRTPLSSSPVVLRGDPEVAEFWLAHSALG